MALLLLEQWLKKSIKGYIFLDLNSVFTDHQPLLHQDTAELNSTVQWWVASLANYNSSIINRQNNTLGNAIKLEREMPDMHRLCKESTRQGEMHSMQLDWPV